MLLKTIKIYNFRQFKNTCIDFSKGENGKNVTLIIGENGTGKTTLEQTFLWCLYGKTDFQDKNLLNKKVANALLPNQKEDVKVEICLIHGDLEYTIIRQQEYRKDYNDNLKMQNTQITIKKKDTDGNTSYIKSTEIDSTIKSILPEELSRYFFFDGERIEKMSKDISGGKKANDFSDAVNGLLGLNAMRSAIDHFEPKRKYGVINQYKYDDSANDKIKNLNDELEDIKSKMDENENDRETINEQKTDAAHRQKDCEIKLKQFEAIKDKQSERESITNNLKRFELSKEESKKSIFDVFSKSFINVALYNLANNAIVEIQDQDFSGSDIPAINYETISFLLERGECLCGTKLTPGSLAYQQVEKLADYVPPKSLSNVVHDFKTHCTKVKQDYEDEKLLDQLTDKISNIRDLDEHIDESKSDIDRIGKELENDDSGEEISNLEKRRKECENIIQRCEEKHNNLLLEYGNLTGKLKDVNEKLQQLASEDEKNRRIALCKAYAERIFEDLKQQYSAAEKKVREKLEKTINLIFKNIYNGGLSLTIDSSYHIKVNVENYVGEVETSTAQSIAVIFAFITAIIQMARENKNNAEADAEVLSSEVYPLVMDAPLSAFDKSRVKSVCESLPKTAEQVVIFIKDLDGELAEQYMGSYIGTLYRLSKIDEFETELV